MSTDRYTAFVDGDQLVLRPPQSRDGAELKHYGARKVRGTSDWSLYPRLQDLELLARDGIDIELPEEWAKKVAAQDRLDQYLQAAKDIEKKAGHSAWETLMGHQRVGVAYLASRRRALLAFTPGLGKSATAVIAADLVAAERILVIAPLTLIPTWKREINQWVATPGYDGIQVVNGKELQDARWTLANPEKMLSKKSAALLDQEWDLIIFDESILYKNRQSKRTKAARDLAAKAQYAWLLSGAPVSAYADDLWAQLSILHPEAFRSYWRFAQRWCALQETPWSTEVVGNRNPEGLREYLRDLMISRTPEDVPGLLPETLQEVVSVKLSPTQEKLLKQMDDLVFETADGERNDITAVIAQLTRMSQAVSCPKIFGYDDLGGKYTALLGLLKDGVISGKVLVWAHYRETVDAYAEQLTQDGYNVATVHGGKNSNEREDALVQFQTGDTQILVMQLQTGKFGLSLTQADYMVYVDRSFSYDDWTQSVARIRRLSSKGKVVPTYILHGGATDKLVDVILNRKLKSVHDLDLSDLKELLR